MSSSSIPAIVIGRLPVYLRALTRMAASGQQRMNASGQQIVSSHELGERLDISSAQIRKDLSHFGEFGKQGEGYEVKYLLEKLQGILKVDREWEVALVGVGDLGRALAKYNGFRHRGFHISLVFDNDPAKIGQSIDGFEVLDLALMDEMLRGRGIRLAMLAVPAEAAQAVADQLVQAGITGILNYAPIKLAVPEGVQVQYIDPVAHLQRMTYYLQT